LTGRPLIRPEGEPPGLVAPPLPFPRAPIPAAPTATGARRPQHGSATTTLMALRKVHPNMNLVVAPGDGSNDAVSLGERTGEISHRDLGQIAVTDIDGITINRTKNNISPFVPILKTKTYSENSGNHTGYAVEIEDPDSETGYKHVGNVSANYLLLSNEEVRTLAVEIAHQSGMPFKESRIFWDGARFCHIIDFPDTSEVVEEGDEV